MRRLGNHEKGEKDISHSSTVARGEGKSLGDTFGFDPSIGYKLESGLEEPKGLQYIQELTKSPYI